MSMLAMWWLLVQFAFLVISFILVISITYLLLQYLESKPSGRRTLMDELNQNVLYCFMSIIWSNYPLTLIVTLQLDMSNCKNLAAAFAITR